MSKKRNVWYNTPQPLHVMTTDDITLPGILGEAHCVAAKPPPPPPPPTPTHRSPTRPAVALSGAVLCSKRACMTKMKQTELRQTAPVIGPIQSPRHQATGLTMGQSCAGGDSRSSKAQRALTLHSTWQASKLMSWTPHLRQFIVSHACTPSCASGSSVKVVLLLLVVGFSHLQGLYGTSCNVCANPLQITCTE